MFLQPIDIGAVVSERLSAIRKLKENPHDVQAIGSMYKAQKKVVNKLLTSNHSWT